MREIVLGIVFAAACNSAAMRAINEPVATRLPDSTVCALDAYPRMVRPHFEDDRFGKATFHRLHGAEIDIPARPGLTLEWLRRDLAGGQGDPRECALDVRGAEIDVVSRGPGFVVTIRATDQDAASEILRRARATTVSSAE